MTIRTKVTRTIRSCFSLAALGLPLAACSNAPAGTDAGLDTSPPFDTASTDAAQDMDAPGLDAQTGIDAGRDARIRPDATTLDAAHDSAVPDTTNADASTSDTSTACTTRTPYVVTPGLADSSASFRAAMAMAAANPVPGLRGPSGADQGRMYLPAGTYHLNAIVMASNVRVEIEPGATITGVPGGGRTVFQFGDTRASPGPISSRNVTLTAGDGCGGPGTPAAKPTNTGFRGNLPGTTSFGTRGMSNEAIPFNAYWPVETMWVMDVDPRATGVGTNTAGFTLNYLHDVLIERVFSIQNPEIDVSTGGLAANAGSSTSVMRVAPVPGGQYVADREQWLMAHRLHVNWHYNILSPSGYGPAQYVGCVDCTADNVFSHGGVTLRLESDGLGEPCGNNVCTGCTGYPPTGIDGQGFGTFGTVENLVAHNIEGVDGNFGVLLNAHCVPNGTVSISSVRTTSMTAALAIGQASDQTGYFGTSAPWSSVTGIQAFVGSGQAQAGDPALNGYHLAAPQSAIVYGARTYSVDLHGVLCWPSTLNPNGLPAGDYTLLVDATCPAWP